MIAHTAAPVVTVAMAMAMATMWSDDPSDEPGCPETDKPRPDKPKKRQQRVG